MIRQTLTNQILANKWLPYSYGQNLLPNFISPVTFNSAIHQALTPPNILTIQYVTLKISITTSLLSNLSTVYTVIANGINQQTCFLMLASVKGI